MLSILFECVKVNFAISLYGHRTSYIPIITKPNNIRKYINKISEFDYKTVVNVIRRDNTLAIGKGLQNRYNKTIF